VGKLKVFVVDENAMDRKILSDAVYGTGLAIAVQTASNGKIALERLKQQTYDVVLLGALMTKAAGIETLEQMKHSYPEMMVIVVSAETVEPSVVSMGALKHDAIDYVLKPNKEKNSSIVWLQNILRSTFLEIMVKKSTHFRNECGLTMDQDRKAEILPMKQGDFKGKPDVIVIASSTGGPEALGTVLTGLPAAIKQPILIVQHMPKDFTKLLAETLNRNCKLPVSEAKAEEVVQTGHIFIAPGGQHMTVKKSASGQKIIHLAKDKFVNGVCPAADVLFHSIAEVYSGKKVLVLILTGMGRDGKQGVMAMKQTCDCYCMTQSERSSVVYGMPGSIAVAGLSDESVDLKQIPHRLRQLLLA
jgi:two-component system, chemotaxis family, protein-glutamate methylesterase/glutaminase